MQFFGDARKVVRGPLLGLESRSRMDDREWFTLFNVKTGYPKSFRNSRNCFLSYGQTRCRSIAYRNARPANQSQLLFDGMQRRPLPKFPSRRRNMIMQARVSIVLKSNSVLRARCARKKCRSSSAVQIVDDVILLSPKFASDARPWTCFAASPSW